MTEYEMVLASYHRRFTAWDGAQQTVEYLISKEDMEEEIMVAGDFIDHMERVKQELVLVWEKVHSALPKGGEV